MYAQTLHSPPASSTSASTIVSVYSSHDVLTSPKQSAGDARSTRSPLSPASQPGAHVLVSATEMTSQRRTSAEASVMISDATPSSDSMSFPSPPSEAFQSDTTTPSAEQPKSFASRKTPTSPVQTVTAAVNAGYLETNIDSPECIKYASHLASQETLDSHSLDVQSPDACSIDAPSLDNLSETGTEIVLLNDEVQYVDISRNRTSFSDADRPGDLPIKSKETGHGNSSQVTSTADEDLLELNSILLSPVQIQSTKEVESDSSILPQDGASMTLRDQSANQSDDAYSPPDQKVVLPKSHDTRCMSHDQSSDAQNLTNIHVVLTNEDRSHGQMPIDIKLPNSSFLKCSGMKTPEMSSSPMDVDSLSSSYNKMVDSFSPNEKEVAMTPDGVSMDELSDLEPNKDQTSKLGQRSRPSRPSTDSVVSSGDELGQGKMDISFHSDKDVLEEDTVFMETNSKSKSSSVDSLDKGPGAPKSPKLEEENTVKSKINTANKELIKRSEKTNSFEADVRKEDGKSPSVSLNGTVSSSNSIVSRASSESNKSAIEGLSDSSVERGSESSFAIRSATETEIKSVPVPKRKRSVKDLLSKFETLSQSPPNEGQGQSPPQGVAVTELLETPKTRPAVFQKPKIVHLKTLSLSPPDASDFSETPQQTFQPHAPMKTTPEGPLKTTDTFTSTPLPKTKDKTPSKSRDSSERLVTNGQSVMSKSLDHSMLLKSLDESYTTELSIDTSCSSDIMSQSVEFLPSEPNKPAKPAKKLGHSPSFKERLRMYEVQKEAQSATKQQQQLATATDSTATSRTDRASSEESVGSVRNLSKMFERQNSNRSEGLSDRSRSVSREPDDPIKTLVASIDSKDTKGAQVSSKDSVSQNTQREGQGSSACGQSASKEKKSVKKLLGMFEQQTPGEQDGSASSSASSDERGARIGKKPWTAIV